MESRKWLRVFFRPEVSRIQGDQNIILCVYLFVSVCVCVCVCVLCLDVIAHRKTLALKVRG